MNFANGWLHLIYQLVSYFFNDQLNYWVAKTYANLSTRFGNAKNNSAITFIILSWCTGDFYPEQYPMGQFA